MSRGAGIVVLTIGVLQLWLGTPLARAPFAELPGDAAAGLLYDGVAPGRDGLGRLVETREGSVALSPRPRAHRDLGMARLLEAERVQDEGEARRSAAAAEDEFLAAARLAPADATVWAMLPFASLRQERLDRAAELLRIGLRVVPYAPDYALNRLAQLLALEGFRDEELEAALGRVLAEAAARDVVMTARFLVDRNVAGALLPRLSGHEELAYELARAVERAVEAEEVEGSTAN